MKQKVTPPPTHTPFGDPGHYVTKKLWYNKIAPQ